MFKDLMYVTVQGRGGDELGAEFAKGLERSMYAGLTGRGSLYSCARQVRFCPLL